jgi:phosphatidylethanolamine/phosphatidyl-N-methylethanolamine N-methyltransferase
MSFKAWRVWTDDFPAAEMRLKVAAAAHRWAGHAQGLARRSPWLAERLHFFQVWRANPQGIGAIVPSSRALAAAMTREIHADCGPVLELGPGTGVFTRALLARGVAPGDLALVERDPRFAARLCRDFPGVQVHGIDAAHLECHPIFDDTRAGAAICGLPLLNFPLRLRLRILRSTFSQLRPGAACYLFTYGVRCPVPARMLERLGIRARRLEVVMANVPPAHVWKLTRRPASRW